MHLLVRSACCNIILSFPFCMKPTAQKELHTNCIERHITAVIQLSLYFLFQSPLFIFGSFKSLFYTLAWMPLTKHCHVFSKPPKCWVLFFINLHLLLNETLIISLDILNVLKSITWLTWTYSAQESIGWSRVCRRGKQGKWPNPTTPLLPLQRRSARKLVFSALMSFR